MPKKILIIDDDPVLVRCLEEQLTRQGYSVVVAYDGMSGLQKAREELPDLITLDVMMPVLNGYSVCAFLKLDSEMSAIPVLMITARCEENDDNFQDDVAPQAYLTKPFKIEDVLQHVSTLIGV
ncbi:MAG: response regulator transcription factor [Candidatus Omnitrophota bacterium]